MNCTNLFIRRLIGVIGPESLRDDLRYNQRDPNCRSRKKSRDLFVDSFDLRRYDLWGKLGPLHEGTSTQSEHQVVL